MAVTVNYKASSTVVETLASSDAPASSAANRKVIHDGYNTTKALSGSTTVPVTKMAAFSQALTAGAATIDLTSLNGTGGNTVDGTGLKLQILRVRAPTTNSNPLTLTKGASNGYGLDSGGSAWTKVLDPGQEMLFYGNNLAPDIAGGVKNIDLSGTGVESVEVMIVMG